MHLERLNGLGYEHQKEALTNCCGSSQWVNEMLKAFPFGSENELLKKGEEVWIQQCNEKDWLEAFTHHPKIGDMKNLEEKFASTKAWASSEQASVREADKEVIAALAKGNQEYEKKFGFIFIVCATGKSADEMLKLLNERLPNDYEKELKIGMQEQAKITQLRLQKLLLS